MQISDEMREAAHRVLWERDQAACTPATVTAALEAALSEAEPVCCGRPVYEGSPEAFTLECCGKLIQPAPTVAAKILELDGVPDALAYGKGIWRTCTGCHESNEGYPTGPFSDTLKCYLGGGCFECGGIGAVWDTTDYEDMGNYIALSAQVQDVTWSPAIKAIAAERRRQVESEGWTPEHDDKYSCGELARAAACYALQAAQRSDETPYEDSAGRKRWWRTGFAIKRFWPWGWGWWKPLDRQRDLEKAGALIAAELDRLIRAAAPVKQEGGEHGR